jgi:prolyl-tRNA editing enzyme YbaK/EbsC (Cys-tRNA(Pro) deacylase)
VTSAAAAVEAPAGTAEAEQVVWAQLRALGVDAQRMACDPDLADTARFCEAYGVAPEDSANTILVIGKSEPPVYAACVVLATSRLDVNRVVRKRLGTRRASFASADETKALTGMLIGGVTAFGLPDGLPIWVDAAVMARPEVVLGGGSRSSKLRVAPGELRKLPAVEVVEGLATPIDG